MPKLVFSGYRVFSRRFVKSFPVRFTGFEIETEIAMHTADISMTVAGVTAADKLINQETPDHLLVLVLAGVIGVVGNGIAAGARTRAGRELRSPPLITDGHHAKVDAMVSSRVVVASALVAVGVPLADPIFALLITAMMGTYWLRPGIQRRDASTTIRTRRLVARPT